MNEITCDECGKEIKLLDIPDYPFPGSTVWLMCECSGHCMTEANLPRTW